MSSHYSGGIDSSEGLCAVSNTDDIRKMVENQDRIAQAGKGWQAVMSGNIEAVMKLYPGEDVYERGRYGENVFLLAMSLATPQSITIAKYLAKTYGSRLIKTPYQSRMSEDDDVGQFEGQTALHLAIVNNDMETCKYLISLGADVRARAIGTFFKHGGNAYYGEYPLHFACALGNKDVALLLRRHGAVPSDRDTQGNTPLHVAVLHGQQEMYDYLVDVLGAKEGVRNRQGLSPLMLATYMGDREMFHHIYSKRVKVAWRYGKLHSYWIPLDELDVSDPNDDQELTAFGVMIRTGQLHLLQDPVMQKIFESKVAKVGFVTIISSVLHVLLLITITFLVDRTINGAQSGIILALHIIVLIYATVQLMQGAFLFLERVWRSSKYLQEQVERTSLVPIYTGAQADAGRDKVTNTTTRRATHSHRKSFEVPKQVAMAIKTSIAMGFHGLVNGGKKPVRDRAEILALTKAPSQMERERIAAPPPRPAPAPRVPAPAPAPAPAAPVAPPSPPPSPPPMDMGTELTAGASTDQADTASPSGGPLTVQTNKGQAPAQTQGSSYVAPSGGYHNRTRVRARDAKADGKGEESAAAAGPSVPPVQYDRRSTGPSRFSSQGRMEGSAADTMPGNLQETAIAEDQPESANPGTSHDLPPLEEFRDRPGDAVGGAPLTLNRHTRIGLALSSIRNELYFSSFEISLWVELTFYIMVIIYFIWWGVHFRDDYHGERRVTKPSARVLLALFTLFGWISGLFVLRVNPALSRMLAIMERVMFITAKVIVMYLFVNLGFALALFSLRGMNGAFAAADVVIELTTIPQTMLQCVRAIFSADEMYDLTAMGGDHSHVIQGFIVSFAVGYYFMVVLLGMTFLRTILSPEELRGDRGDRDMSYWHYHLGMNMLRVWSGVPKFMRQKLILGDETRRGDGTKMRFLQYIEGSEGYRGSKAGNRRSRDTQRHNRNVSDTKKRSNADSSSRYYRGASTESTRSGDGPASTSWT